MENKSTRSEKMVEYAVLVVLILIVIGVKVANAEPTIVFKNKCIDETNFACRNKVQGATREEVRYQVNKACKGLKCPVIVSVDPIQIKGDYLYDVWGDSKQMVFIGMPGNCPDSQRKLRRLVRRN